MVRLMKQRDIRHRRAAVLIACLCLLASSVPYLGGWAVSSDEMPFGGIILTYMEDVYTYLSAMHQGAAGSWTYQILHTPEEHQPEVLKLFYLVLGKAARVLGLSMAAAYQLARLAAGACLLASIYAFSGAFADGPRSHLVAYLIGCAGGGLSWLTAVLRAAGSPWPDWMPVEFWLVESFSLPTIMIFAHGALATAILLVTFLAVQDYRRTGTRGALAKSAALTIALAIVQPMCLPLLGITLCVYQTLLSVRRMARGQPWLQRTEMASIVVIGAISLPLAIFLSLPFWTNEVFRIWNQQSLTPSPSPLHLLWGYGVFVPLAVVGARRVWQDQRDTGLLLIAWILAAGVLLYVPGLPQRRFAQGMIIPWGCLAALGMEKLFRKGNDSRRSRLAYLLIVGLGVVSSTTMVARETQSILTVAEPAFHPREQLVAIEWLKNNTTHQDTVLCGPHMGSFIPAAIGHRVFWVHWCETIDLEGKVAEFLTFFDSGTSDQWRRTFLQQYGIKFLVYEPHGTSWGGFRPTQAPYLMERFRVGDYAVYEVTYTALP